MKKYKVDIKSTLEIIIFGLVYFALSFIKNPTFVYVTLGVFILYLFFDLYSITQYEKGKRSYVFFTKRKNKFSKTISLIVGSLIFTIAIFSIIFMGSLSYHTLIGFVLGSWIIVGGIFESPKRYE